MASAQPRNETQEGVPEVRAFITSLNLSVDEEAQVIEILENSPEVASVFANESKKARSLPVLVYVSCKVARVAFGTGVLLEKPLIEKAVAESWSQTCWESPACVIRPETSTQVSQALKIVTFLRTPFAIRSGGHSPNPGWAGLQDGVLIDLTKLNKLSISKDYHTVSVGPGARWGEVYQYLDPYNVTVIGGRVPQVGVGGLMLGGGISYFTGEYGLAIDNIVNIEVVLADGSIVNANPREHSDLFWALKGGGPNFGIVTRYDLRTVPIKDIWYQMTVYGPEKAPDLLDAFAAWQGSPDTKGSVAMIATLSSVIVGLVYIEPIESPKVFQPFYDIPRLATAVPSTIGTVLALSQISGASASVSARHDYRAASSKIDSELYRSVYEVWKNEAATTNETTGANMTFVLQHIPKNVIDKGHQNGGNSLGLEPIAQQWWTTLTDWDNPTHDDIVRGAAIAITQKWEELGKARGSHLPFLYMNDASRDQNPLNTYTSASLQRLNAVAKKYDPHRVFQTLQNDGFLLSKASSGN
ncbi:FAD-binding domain-containing protein [Lindgomyces ingoldianus]|uniref:FAD-binding domain-containing protein n=1 Tax=Lindgomyces ingoldianus TaxID=673940 RepID=A0ACB6RD58_9PLEO|nr:FAD-binding domain-containing protein [Lindgomyces ingoldianus]KAF2477208.1 FAD-binding domain-containing protein [Lindgomyces ingoldianus]